MGDEQSVNFNVTDGMVFEIDLSNLPNDKNERASEIRSRVKDFIMSIEVFQDIEIKSVNKESYSLSDAVIKNITQIVLQQMDEAFENKNKDFTELHDIKDNNCNELRDSSTLKI